MLVLRKAAQGGALDAAAAALVAVHTRITGTGGGGGGGGSSSAASASDALNDALWDASDVHMLGWAGPSTPPCFSSTKLFLWAEWCGDLVIKQ